MKNITVREWIDKFNHGEFDNEDFKTQCAAGWYDWFCSTKSLAKKLKKMGNIIKDIKNDYILDNFRVWFKNNCPCSYPLYDDFRFEPIKENKEDADDDVRDQLYFGVQCGHPYGSDYMYEIFTGRNGYDIEFKCKNKKEVLQVIRIVSDSQKKQIQSKYLWMAVISQ